MVALCRRGCSCKIGGAAPWVIRGFFRTTTFGGQPDDSYPISEYDGHRAFTGHPRQSPDKIVCVRLTFRADVLRALEQERACLQPGGTFCHDRDAMPPPLPRPFLLTTPHANDVLNEAAGSPADAPTGHLLLARLCAPAGDALAPPRTLLALAHPDDETVGAASRLTRIEAVAAVYATDGAPRDGRAARAAGCATVAEYAQLRRAETLRALAHAGISSDRAVFLGHPDQEAVYRLLPLAADLRRWIIATRPEVVLTHAYEGGHPDHDAVAFAVHAAVARLAQEEDGAVPAIIEFTAYHADGHGMKFGEFLSHADAPEHGVRLTRDARALKQRLLACHRSQAHKWASLPLGEERFRLAPTYDFTRPPHEGDALYERQGAGITVAEWCEVAATATAHHARATEANQTCVLK